MIYQSENLSDVLDQVRNEFNFEVVKRPLVGSLNEGSETVPTDWFACFRDDTFEPVGPGSVKDGYVPHTTEDVVTLVEAAIDGFGKGVTEVKTDFDNGHCVLITPSSEYQRKVSGKDIVFPRLLIQAGLGGSSSFRCTLGLYRSLCANLELFKTHKSFSVSIRHTRHLPNRIDDLRSSFAGLQEGWVNLEGVIDRANQREVDIADILNAIYPQPTERASQRSVTIHRDRTRDIVNRLFQERNRGGYGLTEQGKATAWELFNAVQGYQLHDAIQRGKRSDLQRAILANNTPAVRKAEELLLAA